MDEFAHNGSGTGITTVSRSGTQEIDASLIGVKWTGAISYSDPDSPSDYQAGYSWDTNGNGVSVQNEGFSRLNTGQQQAMHFALDADDNAASAGFSVEGFTNLDISYAGAGSGTGTLRLANSFDPATSFGFFPATTVRGGDAWLGPSASLTAPGRYGWFTVLHELGHNLGLKHGHEIDGFGPLPFAMDSFEYSLMTYRSFIGAPTDFVRTEPLGLPQTYMMLDIAALQHMYGADYTTNSGNTEYTWDPATGETFVNGQSAIRPATNRVFATIWDGGGIDTYNLVNYSTGVTVDLNPGGHSVFSAGQLARLGGGPNNGLARGNVFNALLHQGDERSLIENAIGGRGNDTLIGNTADNALLAHFGNDVVIGLGGNDVLIGGDGDDWLEGDSVQPLAGLVAGADTIAAGTGNDVVIAGDGNDLVHGEADNDTIVGDGGADVLYGDEGYDAVDGGDGGDVLFGGTEGDVLFGAAGSDTLYGGEGFDIMMGERGNPLAPGELDILYGEAGNDTMHGGGGNDWLFGGADSDVMDGGNGSDLIVGGTGAEICLGSGASAFRAANEGNDLFVFTGMADAGDRIWGFDTRPGERDGIDLRSLFDGIGYGGANPVADGFLRILSNTADTFVMIDANGGADAFVPIVTLHGVTSLTTDFFLFQ